MAWGMFFVFPCPYKVWDDSKYSKMLLWFPLIGLIIGGLWVAAHFIFHYLAVTFDSTKYIYPAVMIVTPWVLSGFIHLDGFMDCSDAVLSRRDLSERLRILKDSTVGAFAVIMLSTLIILSYSVFSGISLGGHAWTLVFIPAVSRACSSIALLNFHPLPTSSYYLLSNNEGSKRAKIVSVLELMILLIMIVILAKHSGSILVSLFSFLEVLFYFLVLLVLKKNLGGVSGDVSGCAITVSEFVALVSLLFA